MSTSLHTSSSQDTIERNPSTHTGDIMGKISWTNAHVHRWTNKTKEGSSVIEVYHTFSCFHAECTGDREMDKTIVSRSTAQCLKAQKSFLKRIKVCIVVHGNQPITELQCHLPHGITQRYLPHDTGNAKTQKLKSESQIN